MPGIVGIVAKDNSRNRSADLRTMVQTMMHESYYDSCEVCDDQTGYYFSCVSIRDSFANRLTASQKADDPSILMAGELFTDVGEKPFAEQQGICRSAIKLLDQHNALGDDIFAQLNGWFAGILYDRRNRKAVLFNDRYGMQRVYCHENEEAFYFASEAKALLKLIPSLRELSSQSIGEYLALDCVLDNQTYFKKIQLLPGASCWTFQNRTISRNHYFTPSMWENLSENNPPKTPDDLGREFLRIVPRYFSGENIGMTLTGGLDTRMIFSSMRFPENALPCFTFAGPYRESLDARIARRVAGAGHQSHQVIRLTSEFLSDYVHHLQEGVYLSDGLANATTADELYLNRIARNIAKIKVTGKFGSQVMRALAGLRPRLPDPNLIHPDFAPQVELALDKFKSLQSGHSLSFFLFSEIPWYWSCYTALEQSQLSVRSPFLDNDFVKLLYQIPPGAISGDFQWKYIGKVNPALTSIMTNGGRCNNRSKLAKTLLSSAYRTIGAMDKVYTWDRIPHGLTHWVARADRFAKPFHLVDAFRGYGYFRHYRVWFRDELSRWVKEILLDEKTLQRPYWNGPYLKQIVQDHISGKGNYMLEIRKALSLEMIQRTLIESA
jgi:asparagine synthase (glutamine-hydrolysing)